MKRDEEEGFGTNCFFISIEERRGGGEEK